MVILGLSYRVDARVKHHDQDVPIAGMVVPAMSI
jgi:hypothetical protein